MTSATDEANSNIAFIKYRGNSVISQVVKPETRFRTTTYVNPCLHQSFSHYQTKVIPVQLDHEMQWTFQPTGAIAFDSRILSYNLEGKCVSIWTIGRRQRIAFGGREAAGAAG